MAFKSAENNITVEESFESISGDTGERYKTLVREREEFLTQSLLRAQKEVSEFARIISHDLKAPLRGISSLATWLYEDNFDKLDDEGRQNLLLLQERVEKMDAMIDGILTYAAVTKGEKKIEEVDLNKVLESVLQLISKPENFEIIQLCKMPVVNANSQHMNQLFHNLISNAIYFNDKPDGKVWLDVTLAADNWEFSVRDNGKGIAPEHHQKIFNLFQTLETRDPKPSGVGLSIVKKIVELYGGEIRIESEIGVGTAFKFTLPKTARE